MTSLKKILVILTAALALAGTSTLVFGHCGSCGVGKSEGSGNHDHDHDHDHSKTECVKCAHEKSCKVEGCSNEAHHADCTCPKKDSEMEEEE